MCVAGSRLGTTVVSGRVTEIVDGLDAAELERIEALRTGGRFFWIDI
jgi:hypothetical protein